ncbi:MAG: DUF1559 domain-containing protein [Pirellulales bacterium]
MSTDPSPAMPEPVKKDNSVWWILLIVVGALAFFCLIGVGLLTALLLPAIQGAREAARRVNCVNNLKQIGIALVSYHDQYNSFPPAYLADANGRPMHSWRVLVLPFFSDPEATALYRQYHFDEPWDGPNNRKLAAQTPSIFVCPSGSNSEGHTHYVAVVGNETVWPGSEAGRIRKISDGTANTIAVVETVRMNIAWLEPRDLTMDEAMQAIIPPAELGLATAHPGGANVLFSDGSVHFLDDSVAPQSIRALLTIAGGEEIDEQVLGF